MATTGTRSTDLSPAKRRRPARLAILMGAVEAAIEWSGAVLRGRIPGRRHAKLRLTRSGALAGVFACVHVVSAYEVGVPVTFGRVGAPLTSGIQ